MTATLKAGTSAIDITPPPGVWMTGFAHRPGPAEGVLDPLFARALVLENGATRLAIVALDVIQLEHSLDGALKRKIEERTGIPPGHLMVNATHTHSGPAVSGFHRAMGPYEEKTALAVCDAVVCAVSEAAGRLDEVDLFFGEAETIVGFNRRQPGPDGRVRMGAAPDRPYDSALPVLRIDSRRSGQPVALLFSHACHPVILGPDNLSFSTDFPGTACRVVSENLGQETVALFLQGCCGNINPPWGDRSGAAVETIGRKLGEAVVRAAHAARPLAGGSLCGIAREVVLPLSPAAPAEEYERQAEAHLAEASRLEDPVFARVARARADWALEYARLSREGRAPRERKMVVQALRIGELAISAIQAEPFVETGMAIRKRSPFEHTVTLGYTNGCLGYLPTAESYPEGGYEVVDSAIYYNTLMFAPEAEAMVVNWSVELLDRLRRKY